MRETAMHLFNSTNNDSQSTTIHQLQETQESRMVEANTEVDEHLRNRQRENECNLCSIESGVDGISTNCSLVTSAINAGVLATNVTAPSAAFPLQTQLALAEAIFFLGRTKGNLESECDEEKRQDREGKAMLGKGSGVIQDMCPMSGCRWSRRVLFG